MRDTVWCVAVAVVTCAQGLGAGSEVAAPSARYAHAYYLFLAGPVAEGGDRSVPLVLTSHALEEVARGNREPQCILITTYERDSVFWVKQGVEILPADVKPLERHVRMPTTLEPRNQRWFRYQEVNMAEVRHLLEHPEGSIPVHRPGTSREELDAILAALKRSE